MNKVLIKLQLFEYRLEQYVNRPVHFLRFIKEASFPQDTPYLGFSLTEKNKNLEDLIKLLREIQIPNGRKRQVVTKYLLTQMPSPVLQKSFPVQNVDCYHISFVTPDRIWASDGNDKIVLLDTTTGDDLYTVKDLLRDSWLPRGLNPPELKAYIPLGVHTVNSRCELIYINDKNEMNKLSRDGKTTRLGEKPQSPWELQCVYCSPFTGDLLVGMRGDNAGRVRRYNSTGKLVKTIPPENTSDNKLYNDPRYITENNNEDVVVSDWRRTPGHDHVFDVNRGVVVVTDRRGNHRFSYSGPPSGSQLWPHSVCSDAFSHILVCDRNTNAVQMLNKDGEFLSYLLTTEQSEGINLEPRSLSYDFFTHLLWVGSSETVSAYRHVNRHLDLTDTTEPCS